ncbi:MAG: xanthine phosphoribosyltransferase [Firmicutes bacterium]|nr:xanthine phosphoribosyltransferase [Bacillota bacterium]
MKLLKDRILKEGIVVDQDIVRVDMFLNHQLDVDLLYQLGRELFDYFSKEKITKILTVEASGIPLACLTALHFGVPVVYAKKGRVRTQEGNTFSSEIFSYTRNETAFISVHQEYLKPQDRVLVIDDFLASGNAVLSLKNLIDQAGAELAGVGIAIEKGFQEGRGRLKALGINLYSLAIIASLEDDQIIFA